MYNGLVIGGPKAGCRISCKGPSFHSEITDTTRMYFTDRDMNTDPPVIGTLLYTHHKTNVGDFWIRDDVCYKMADCDKTQHILDALMRQYENTVGIHHR